jgi:hypothetical protein
MRKNPSPAVPSAVPAANPAYRAFCEAREAPARVHPLKWACLAEDLRQAGRGKDRSTLARVLLHCAHEAQTRSEG